VGEDGAAGACAASGAVGSDGAVDVVDAEVGAVLGVELPAAAAVPDEGADVNPTAAAADPASPVERAVSARWGSFEAAVARENPAGVCGASPGPSCDDASALVEALEEAVPDFDEPLEEAVPDPTVDPVTIFEDVAGEVGAVLEVIEVGEVVEVAGAVEAEDFPFFLDAPRLADAFAALPFEPSAREINKPSKNSNRGCDGESWRNLSTSVRAVLKSSALNAVSVCAMRSVTSCGY
jgi:hypothetical protein